MHQTGWGNSRQAQALPTHLCRVTLNRMNVSFAPQALVLGVAIFSLFSSRICSLFLFLDSHAVQTHLSFKVQSLPSVLEHPGDEGAGLPPAQARKLFFPGTLYVAPSPCYTHFQGRESSLHISRLTPASTPLWASQTGPMTAAP